MPDLRCATRRDSATSPGSGQSAPAACSAGAGRTVGRRAPARRPTLSVGPAPPRKERLAEPGRCRSDRPRDARRSPCGLSRYLGGALSGTPRSGRMQEWLWQNDRNAMAAGLENRSPFLDHRLAGWATTPYHAKFSGARNKCELRALFEGFLTLPTAQRLDKQGFRWAYGRFLRQNWKSVAELIRGSTTVRRLCRVEALNVDFDQDPALADQSLLQRLIVLAGLEASGAVSAA